MRIRAAFALIFILCSFTACRKKARVTQTPPVPQPAVAQQPRVGSTETGVASWYGPPYHGRRAADGEIYDMEKMTAAHRTLPFNTWVHVRNLTNEKSCEVRITDRGPFVDGRVIDLSKAAARSIDMLGPGTATVELTIMAAPQDLPAQQLFAVQVGAFRDRGPGTFGTRWSPSTARRALSSATQPRHFGACWSAKRPRSRQPPIWRNASWPPGLRRLSYVSIFRVKNRPREFSSRNGT